MTQSRIRRIATTAMIALAWPAIHGSLCGQVTTVTSSPAASQVQLAFGYECGDRFLVRNDGARAVDLEYGVTGGGEHSKLHLNGRESVELSSSADRAVELWVDGKLVATALKGARACVQSPPASAVVVRPIGPGDYVANVDPGYAYAPRVVYAGVWPYDYYYPYYTPFFGVSVFPRFGYGRVVFRGRR